MNSKQFQELIERFISEESKPEEIEALRRMLTEEKYAGELDTIMDSQLANSTAAASDFPEVVDRLKKILEQNIATEKKSTVIRRLPNARRWMAAAAIIILLAIGGFIWVSNQSSKKTSGPDQTLAKIDVQPGKNGAILTLSNGSTVVLDSLGNGVIATENGSQVMLDNGQLVYGKDGAASGPVYNTISTPKGRQFRLLLQDGTKVWLNAASSLRYPTLFTGKERKVEVTGEVYFEVAKNPKAPFRVKVNEQTDVEVLGTHFNINSYTNESNINTTLLEGSVKVTKGMQRVIIKPGQQAQIGEQAKIKVVNEVDVDKVMAWKDGKFNFKDATLKEVMRELERWYDIEVVYEKGVQEQEFYGSMDRGLTLSEVLHGLNLSEVKFRIEKDKKLVLVP